jgi:hypothetical protein
MIKKLLMLALFTTAVVAGTGLYTRRAATQEINTATLSGLAAQAISLGRSEVYISNHDFYAGVDGLDAALARFTVIEATPISKNSYVMDEFSIGTWYKFKINRTIKQNPLPACSDCSSIPDPPADMLPLNWDEIMVLHAGGTQVVDGVTFYINVPNFPGFNLNQKYLLFVDYDPDKRVAMVSVGPPGVYFVDGYENLSHIYTPEEEDTIGSGLAASYGNNANTLYNALNPPPPPPACDPVQEQNCYDSGGDWDSINCRCIQQFDPCLRKPWLCE